MIKASDLNKMNENKNKPINYWNNFHFHRKIGGHLEIGNRFRFVLHLISSLERKFQNFI